MPYTPPTFTTTVTAANLNHMGAGIEDATDIAESAQSTATAAQTTANAAVPATKTQSAEGSNTPVFSVVPATAGFAPFQVQAQSYANTGVGAGTYNHIVAFGYNAARSTGGSATSGKPGVYMAFEDNYYDDGGDATYGPEWYTGYTTPDGTTLKHAGLRPLYWRVKAGDVNSATKDVLVNVDLGAGTGGALSVGNFETHVSGLPTSFREIFIVSRSAIYNRQTAHFTANSPGGSGTLKVAPLSGFAQLDIVAPGTGTAGTFGIIAFKDTATAVWNVTATTGEFYIEDQINGPRKQMSMTPGASSTAATTTFNSNVVINGKLTATGTIAAKTTSYTPVLADADTLLTMDSASAQVFTIPPNSSVAYPVGTVLEFARFGAGSVTITPGSGVTIPNSIQAAGTTSRTITSQFTSVTATKTATNVWWLTGSLS